MTNGKYIEVSDKDLEIAERIVGWLKGLSLDSDDNYLANLAAVGAVGRVTFDMANLAASALRGYARQARETLTAELQRDVYAGAEGDKIDMCGTVVRAESKSGMYGSYVLFNFIADNGAMITSFATGKDAQELADNPFVVGERRRIFAKIKKCERYQGLASTIVSHLVIQPEDFVIPAKPARKTRAKTA